jgi:biotin synthase-related radical SAM superfamily protein
MLIKTKAIYHVKKGGEELCVSHFADFADALCNDTWDLRKKQFKLNMLTHISMHELILDEGKLTIATLEELNKPPVETLELNVAAKKKPVTKKKLNVTMTKPLEGFAVPPEPQW